MKRRDELVVGATILFAMAVVTAGAIWLARAQVGSGQFLQTARFQTVGGLGEGNPVVLRGVRVGRVRTIRLSDDGAWVLADLQIYEGALLPPQPAIIAASASLFGEWQAEIIDLQAPPNDPTVQRALLVAGAVGGEEWPGATLPDIGQLTAQAGRIATDIATVSSRIQTAFDSQTVLDVQRSIRGFGQIADTLTSFTEQQTAAFGDVTTNIRRGSDVVTAAALDLERALARLDSATSDGELDSIVANLQTASQEMRSALASFRVFAETAEQNRESFVRMMVGADSVMTRMQGMTGTLGLLVGDSTLYYQASDAIVQFQLLIADIRANPRKYFKFSVF